MQIGSIFERLVVEETGAGMMEYAVLTGMIALAAMASMKGVVQAIQTLFYNGSLKVAGYWPGW